MHRRAYAQGYGLALAMDDFGIAATLRELEEELQDARAVGDKRMEKHLREEIARIKRESGAKDSTPVKTSPKNGANATPHPAKHEVARAEIAGKTGITGGPPMNKGSKVPSGKQPLILPKMNWPSSDAELGSKLPQNMSTKELEQELAFMQREGLANKPAYKPRFNAILAALAEKRRGM